VRWNEDSTKLKDSEVAEVDGQAGAVLMSEHFTFVPQLSRNSRPKQKLKNWRSAWFRARLAKEFPHQSSRDSLLARGRSSPFFSPKMDHKMKESTRMQRASPAEQYLGDCTCTTTS